MGSAFRGLFSAYEQSKGQCQHSSLASSGAAFASQSSFMVISIQVTPFPLLSERQVCQRLLPHFALGARCWCLSWSWWHHSIIIVYVADIRGAAYSIMRPANRNSPSGRWEWEPQNYFKHSLLTCPVRTPCDSVMNSASNLKPAPQWKTKYLATIDWDWTT